jgi:hypothetical protein
MCLQKLLVVVRMHKPKNRRNHSSTHAMARWITKLGCTILQNGISEFDIVKVRSTLLENWFKNIAETCTHQVSQSHIVYLIQSVGSLVPFASAPQNDQDIEVAISISDLRKDMHRLINPWSFELLKPEDEFF